MIEGTAPLIALWAIVAGSLLGLGLHLATPWRATPMGRHLTVYMAVIAAWYTELLIASYTGYPAWMQTVEAVTFMAMPLVIWWRVGMQLHYRRNTKRPNPKG